MPCTLFVKITKQILTHVTRALLVNVVIPFLTSSHYRFAQYISPR